MLEIYIFITLLIAVLYCNNHPYYPNRNKGIELFVVSIITIVTGIYDSRWRVFSRPRLETATARKYTRVFLFLAVLLSWTNLFVNNLIAQRSNTFVPSIDLIYFRYMNKIREQKVLYILSRLNTYNHAETYEYLNIYR